MTSERVERRLAAVLAADVAGYSRLMGADEVGTLQVLKAHRREMIDPSIASYRGRIVKTTGDGMLVEFASVVDAVTCAMAVQAKMLERNTSATQQITFRIGINVGDIIIDGDDIFGDGVNVAARVENECEPGGVCLSASAFEQVRGKTEFAFDDLGERPLKNIERPVRLYAVRSADPSTGASAEHRQAQQKPRSQLPLPDMPSIAALPFQNMSGDPEQEYFADGIVEDIITGLSRFKSLFVIARNSSFTYKGKAVDIKQVGRELGVRYVLEGSIRKSGGRVRITGQLIDSTTGAHLWADKFDGALEDVFDLQDQITAKVVSSVAPTIDRAEIERAKQRAPSATESYDAYLRGMALFNRNATEARRLFKKAIELDPEYAAAYAMSAHTYTSEKAREGIIQTPEMQADALRDAESALRITSDDAFVLARCAHPLAYVCKQFDRAAALADRAAVLNPNLSVVWNSRGWISIMLADAERAIESFEKLQRLNPLDPVTPFSLSGIAFAHFFRGRYDEGRRIAKDIMQVLPHHQSFGAYIVNCVALGDISEANKAATQLLKSDPNFSVSRAAEVFVIQSPEMRRKFDDALRAVGVPE